METAQPLTISKRTIRSLVYNTGKSAAAVNLLYVSDKEPGITREKNGTDFVYRERNRKITSKETLERIRNLVIPPAWERVWICTNPDGHLQATGYDQRHRKQYLYHPLWKALRSQTKFFHLYDLGKSLPDIRQRLKADLNLPGLPANKVLATIVTLMENTGIRVGNSEYEKMYGSFGVTTLKDHHVQIRGNELTFSFKGKKGVYQNVKLKSKKLVHIVKQCRDIPGRELFQYYDENGTRHAIDSGMVNEYIKNICAADFTSKDFRTWCGTVCALEVFCTAGCSEDAGEIKTRVNQALDTVAEHLGNTRSVCKKYYVHPIVIDHFTNNTLGRYINNAATENQSTGGGDLNKHEEILMKILEDASSAVIAA